MDGSLKIDLDRLPIKRLEAIDEAGLERFPSEIGQDEKRLELIRRIDFSTLVDRDAKKAKSSREAAAAPPPWPWHSLVENLHLAHQELSVIIDLINTVEANDAVTVAGMTRPKPLPNEVLSDLAVSTATKLQHFRHLGRYFKQSSKALEQQVAREGRFYGALIRLQQNWKVKRQRLTAAGPGSDGFIIDLLDNSLLDIVAVFRPSSLSTVRVDHDSSGMLVVQLPPKSCRSLSFGFIGAPQCSKPSTSNKRKACSPNDQETKQETLGDDEVDGCVKKAHSVVRNIHQAIFDEQVFDLVNRETFYISSGVNVTGMREDFLQLGIGQEASIFLCLVPSEQEDTNQMIDLIGQMEDDTSVSHSDLPGVEDKHDAQKKALLGLPNPRCFEIYLKYLLHEHVFVRAKERYPSALNRQVSGQPAGDGFGLLSHFCLTIAHRIFSNKVLMELEKLVSGVPYVHLISHATWHSRTSSWFLCMKVPQSIFRAGRRMSERTNGVRARFNTNVVVNDERISVTGEGVPDVIGSLDANCSLDGCSLNSYGCDLADLLMILLQQVASQVIRWLHEEALVVGMKASRDFLCLYLELEQGDKLGLAAHVDPEDVHGCISWWLLMDDGSMEEEKLHADFLLYEESEKRRFLGHLSLEALYSTLMDLVRVISNPP